MVEWSTIKNNFTLTFIDPTGFSGYALKRISPLLKVQNSEVLVNFMTEFVRRFVDHPDEKVRKHIDDLYGVEGIHNEFKVFSGNERNENMVLKYCELIKKEGKFKHVIASPIFNPKKDSIHFYLVFCTRHSKGLEVFKEQEKKVFPIQQEKILEKMGTVNVNTNSPLLDQFAALFGKR